MTNYTEYFLNSQGSVVELECLEISHPSFSQTFRIVRNATLGITVTHEDLIDYEYIYVPMKIEKSDTKDDLDQGISITLGDLGEILAPEVDNVAAGIYFNVKPTVIYRIYRSDDVSSPMLKAILQMRNLTTDDEGMSTFIAGVPSLNDNKTGEVYSLLRFPPLKGYI